MTPEQESFILDIWVPALRSGKYEQTKEVLHDENGYCCLGVACSLIPEIPKIVKTAGKHFTVIYDGRSEDLGSAAKDHIGISNIGTFSPMHEECGSLVELNDDLRWTFQEIADFIEEELMNPESEYTFI